MKILSLVSLILIVSFNLNAKDYPEVTLSKLITPAEQKALGVTKLSPSEKETLRLVLIQKYLAGFEEGKKKAKVVQPTTPSSIESQIDGDFEGFEGETIIKLMNGQIWQQTEYWYHYHYSYMPNVLIFKSGGGYKMKVDGIDKAIGVMLLN
ncbi:hypothetical protein [Pseudoalteromonas sp. SA25]|uniref:hypothetical protein n=1 Tax=Pseudoalteromonas sp. SA25 TaxID=2686347 RepID=UPI0013FD1C5D|nr:hypothetical protein [Pseudoalteromonas sp. SA25]